MKSEPNMGKPDTKTKRKTKQLGVPPASGKPGAAAESAPASARPSGRGAAPWAARHAAKHAAEARARNAEPPRPGSARATLRVPDEAERIKARIGELNAAVLKIRGMRKHLATNFYEIGLVLQQIQDNTLYDAKGYSSFEAFADREIDLGKAMALKLVRIPSLFQRQATELGLEALIAALNAIDEATGAALPKPAPGSNRPALPLKPPRSNRN
jgi:hypothetical protein